MDEVKTMDPRGLEHSEREALIFPSIEGIRKDETLRIVMEVLKETREAKRIEVKAPPPGAFFHGGTQDHFGELKPAGFSGGTIEKNQLLQRHGSGFGIAEGYFSSFGGTLDQYEVYNTIVILKITF